MKLAIRPTKHMVDYASQHIKMLDEVKYNLVSNTSIVSKTARNLKTVKPTVTRYFEEPGQVTSYYGEGEYDLNSLFKMLKYEAYFMKATQKKQALLIKSGVGVGCDNDDVKNYMDKRFLMMQLQTGVSFQYIINQLAFYLIVCSNAFLVKVRDKECPFARSYQVDGKERQPVVGLFLAHPTTMKPKWKYIKENGLWKVVLDKWVQTNKRGQIKEFPVEDVAHFTLFKEDGMLFGTPELIPVIDDIRTLRKMEEDAQLLIYRDLFPIIHYAVDEPRMIDHSRRRTELDQARDDMQKIVQDGGIATDARHEIKFVGSEGKGIDAKPYLEYFQQRVFTGLGVSALDMSIAGQANLGDAQSVSNQLIDSVKFIQYELARQFNELILMELAIQSPFDDIYQSENMPKLQFEEIDVEWKIRKENHQADLFAKGVDTVHETRNVLGRKTVSDEDLMYTHPSMYGAQPAHVAMMDTQYGDKFAQQQGKVAHATAVETVTKATQPGNPTKTTHTKPIVKTGASAATSDPIKKSKSNSNIVKKKAQDMIQLTDMQQAYSLREEFLSAITSLQDSDKAGRKINIVMATKFVYDKIKTHMSDKLVKGMEDAANDLGLDAYDTRMSSNIYAPLDKLRDTVADMVYKDSESIRQAANRIAVADRTEQQRAYNYGYAIVCKNAGYNKFEICAEHEDIADDSKDLLGNVIDITSTNIVDVIPPFRPNSRLKIKVIQPEIDA